VITFFVFFHCPLRFTGVLLAFCFLRKLVPELCSKNKKTAAERLGYDSFPLKKLTIFL